ncbi:MAG: AtpZ/AtpI family protein [Kiritimatiellae bacterium]|nr:AtpZ/AtpI family protein [Kiritimatiellia bacterium]
MKSPWAYSGPVYAGTHFVVCVLIPIGIGLYLDKRFGWAPWGLVGGAALGFVTGVYAVIRPLYMQTSEKDGGAADADDAGTQSREPPERES